MLACIQNHDGMLNYWICCWMNKEKTYAWVMWLGICRHLHSHACLHTRQVISHTLVPGKSNQIWNPSPCMTLKHLIVIWDHKYICGFLLDSGKQCGEVLIRLFLQCMACPDSQALWQQHGSCTVFWWLMTAATSALYVPLAITTLFQMSIHILLTSCTYQLCSYHLLPTQGS